MSKEYFNLICSSSLFYSPNYITGDIQCEAEKLNPGKLIEERKSSELNTSKIYIITSASLFKNSSAIKTSTIIF